MGKNGRRKRPASFDGVSDRAIYERDDWQCRMPTCLCPDGRALDRKLLGKDDPWSPSIDHIVPLVFNGRDSADNKRAAHKRCNNKSAPRTQQTRGVTWQRGRL